MTAATSGTTKRDPVTRSRLVQDLRALGLAPGTCVLVHCSLSRIGLVICGTRALIDALLEVLGPSGTLMMPAHSGDLSEPSRWRDPPVPADWVDRVREEIPVWDPQRTPTRGMGAVAEHFRRWPGVVRSNHPQVSFAALGPEAPRLLADHAPGDALGETSPIGALYALDGQVLLIGVDHGRDTSLHLAEYRARWPGRGRHTEGAPMEVDGRRRWVRFDELVLEDDDFQRLGAEYEAASDLPPGRVGHATSRLLRQRPLVDWATAWMERCRA
jgi:aminoglycoside 3-N-acetyltransferase